MKKKWDLKRLLFNITSLVDLGQEVTSAKSFAENMKSTLYVVTGMFSVPRAVLLVYNSQTQSLEPLTSKGIRDAEHIRISVASKNIKAFSKNRPVNINEFKNGTFYEQSADAFEKFQTKTFIPLFAKDEFIGALSLGKRLSRASYLSSEKDVLTVIANQMAITLHNSSLFQKLATQVAENKRLYENMRTIYHDTIEAFAAAIDAKDGYTRNHSLRVAKYSVAIARELGWNEKDIESIYIAGLLHDIGKIIIDIKVINKGGELSTTEISEIKRHPKISSDILSKIKFPWENVVTFVRSHHERIDGTGYPDALKGAELSDGVKILAIADAFDAMTTDRPYRDRLPLLDALKEVRTCCGTQFDDKISKVFLNVLQKELIGDVNEPQILPHLYKDFDSKTATRHIEELLLCTLK